MTETTKPRTLEQLRIAAAAIRAPDREWMRVIALIEEADANAYARGLAARASPEEGRLPDALRRTLDRWVGAKMTPLFVAEWEAESAALRSPPAPTEETRECFNCAYAAEDIYGPHCGPCAGPDALLNWRAPASPKEGGR